MRWNYLAAGSVLLILASLTGAEYLGTTISTDGTAHLCGTIENENGLFASRVMTVGASELTRIIGENSGVQMSVHGAGPVLFSDYTMKDQVSPLPLACIFLNDRNIPETQLYTMTSGILERGTYVMSRESYPDLFAESLINGTGFILMESGNDENMTLGSAGFVSGNMTVHDTVRL